jgi:hypothetical protein
MNYYKQYREHFTKYHGFTSVVRYTKLVEFFSFFRNEMISFESVLTTFGGNLIFCGKWVRQYWDLEILNTQYLEIINWD